MKLLKIIAILLLTAPHLSFGGGEGNNNPDEITNYDELSQFLEAEFENNSNDWLDNPLADIMPTSNTSSEQNSAQLFLDNTENSHPALPEAKAEAKQEQPEKSQEQKDYELALELATKEHQQSHGKEAVGAKRPRSPELEQVQKKSKQEEEDVVDITKEAVVDITSFNNTSTLDLFNGKPNGLSEDPELELAIFLSMQSNYQEQEDATYGTTIKLPEDLEKLPLVHLKSIQQHDEVICGSRATLNAWAIQALLQKGKPVTAQAIQDKAKEQEDRVSNEKLEVSKITELAQKLQIHNKKEDGSPADDHNVYILNYKNGIQSATGEMPFTKENLKQHINQLKDLKQWCIHFICNTGDHWVLISLVKQRDKEPVLLYLNSMNTAVTDKFITYNLLQELHAACFAKLEEKK